MTLGGCVVFSGSLPLSKTFAESIPSEARKVTELQIYLQRAFGDHILLQMG